MHKKKLRKFENFTINTHIKVWKKKSSGEAKEEAAAEDANENVRI